MAELIVIRGRTLISYIRCYVCLHLYVLIYVLKYHYPLRWGRGVSKRYLMDITCQNMISILKYSPLIKIEIYLMHHPPITIVSHISYNCGPLLYRF